MNRSFIVLIILTLYIPAMAQDDEIEQLLNLSDSTKTEFVTATFKATRILNSHSIERMPQGQLDFRIHHRFNTINSGIYNFWGLDGATTHFSLEYGITDWLMIGLGRGTEEKTYDGFAKFSIKRQTTGSKPFPVSISYFTSIAVRTLDFPYVNNIQNNSTYPFSSRLSYVNQLLLARKLNAGLSLQVMPVWIHYNLVTKKTDKNNIYAFGFGGRYKLTKRTSFNIEYFYIFNAPNNYTTTKYYNSLSMGFDIETGGHVFQLIFTNSQGMTEKDFIGRNTGSWHKGDIHFGFNISRVFNINRKL